MRDYPVAWHKDLGMWIVSSHELCDKMLKDNRFTPNFRDWEHAPPPKAEADKNDFDKSFEKGFFAVSTKEHLRLRKLTMPAFSRPVMGKIDAKIRDLVTECFDEIGDAAEFDVYERARQQDPGAFDCAHGRRADRHGRVLPRVRGQHHQVHAHQPRRPRSATQRCRRRCRASRSSGS